MTQQEMLFLVPRKLYQIKKEYGIRLLYAAESGSRAWEPTPKAAILTYALSTSAPRSNTCGWTRPRMCWNFPLRTIGICAAGI